LRCVIKRCRGGRSSQAVGTSPAPPLDLPWAPAPSGLPRRKSSRRARRRRGPERLEVAPMTSTLKQGTIYPRQSTRDRLVVQHEGADRKEMGAGASQPARPTTTSMFEYRVFPPDPAARISAGGRDRSGNRRRLISRQLNIAADDCAAPSSTHKLGKASCMAGG